MVVKLLNFYRFKNSGGESGIRTHDTGSHGIHTFQACAFDHSAISPYYPLFRGTKYKKNIN